MNGSGLNFQYETNTSEKNRLEFLIWFWRIF